MGLIIGRGRYKTGVYPSGSTVAAGAAVAALRNRNVALIGSLTAPFTPSNSIIAAILFTPVVSGVVQVSANVLAQNGGTGDTYVLGLGAGPGTGLTVTGGEITVNGWVAGTNTPPVVGGTPGTPVLAVQAYTPLLASASGSFDVFGISDPLPIGVPSVVLLSMTQVGGGHSLAQLAIADVTVMELP